jgi:hypothetical protein
MIDGAVETGADLVASVEPNFFDDVTPETSTSAAPEDGSVDNFIETPGEIETPAGDAPAPEPPVEEPPAEETPELNADGTPVETKPADTPAPTDLPEGVIHGKDKNGKPGLFVTPERWKTIYDGAYKPLVDFAQVIGEPITAESIKEGGNLWVRDQAYQAQERLYNDINSGDPGAQGAVVNYFLNQMTEAKANGEVSIDPTVPFAKTVYSALNARAENGAALYPDAVANLQLMASRDTLSGLFEHAAKTNNSDLALSLQHVVKAMTGGTDIASTRAIAERMGLPFYTKAELEGLAKGPDPVQALRQRNQELEAQLNGRSTQSQTAQYDAWKNETWTAMEKGIADEVVQPALTPIAEAWKAWPAEYKKNVVDELHSKLDSLLRADPVLKNTIARLQQQSKQAPSAQVRQRIAQQITAAWTNRARLATDLNMPGNILRPILNSANTVLTGLSNSNHARRQAAQGRTAPIRGANGSVNRSVTPPAGMPGGVYDPGKAYKDGLSALN